MKHAGADTLGRLAPLLAELRLLTGLNERTPGSFYRKGTAFLHFHEDPTGTFADVKLNGAKFERMPINTPEELAAFRVKVGLAPGRAN